jgi:hypothetical protein
LTVAQSGFRIRKSDDRGRRRLRSMEPTKELIDDIYRERVLRARKTPIEQKIAAGGELFEGVCERMADGLRHENPGADDATIQELLRCRLALLRRLEYPTR